jgi:hypothetical protein
MKFDLQWHDFDTEFNENEIIDSEVVRSADREIYWRTHGSRSRSARFCLQDRSKLRKLPQTVALRDVPGSIPGEVTWLPPIRLFTAYGTGSSFSVIQRKLAVAADAA